MIGRILQNVQKHGRRPESRPRQEAEGVRQQLHTLPPILLPSEKPSPVPYRLHVTLVLEKHHVAGLLQPGAAEALTAMHAPAGLGLLHSAWNFNEAREDTDRVTIYNVWTMFDADSLLRAELLLPDEPAYAVFQRHVIAENKDLILPVVPKTFEGPDPSTFNYLRIRRALRLPKVAEYSARLEAGVIPFCQDNGWGEGQAYFSLTGRTGSITQLWKVPSEISLARAQELLEPESWSQPELFDRNIQPDFLLLTPTPGDPTIAKGVKFHAV